jgi:DeoR family fructose operon transcriptional repressor
MIPAARQQKILRWLMQEGHLSTNELETRLNVSPMTIWRDLKILEESGMLRRVRGGIEYVHTEAELNSEAAPLMHLPQKQSLPLALVNPHKLAIGRYVADEIISASDDIILEGGTTVAAMIPFIDKPDITMLTNGLNTLAFAQISSSIETVMCCGGVLNQNTYCFIGPHAERFFYSYHVDKVFVSAHTYIPGEGFFDLSPLYDSMKRTICSRARTTILLLDSNKFGLAGLVRVLELDEVDLMVTDWEAPPQIINEIRAAGVEVRVAPKY